LKHFVAAGVLFLLAFLLGSGMDDLSPTADEPSHLVRGISFWAESDTRLLYAHPPLANAIQGLPGHLLVEHPAVLSDLEGWETANTLELHIKYFESAYSESRLQLDYARRATALYSILFASFLYAWCYRRYEWRTAIIALVLYSTCYPLIAHAQLATTDFPLAASTFVAVAALEFYIRKPGITSLAAYACAGSIVCITKHSGVPIIAVLTAIAGIFAWRGAGRFYDPNRAHRLQQLGIETLVVAAAAVLAINVVYRFDHTMMSVSEIMASSEPQNWISKRFDNDLIGDSGIWGVLPEGLRIPLPFDYLIGLATVRAQNALGHGGYFAGMHRPSHPAYFPTMLLIKTPLAMLIPLVWGSIAAWKNRWKDRPETRIVAAFALIYLTLACLSRINIGVRHALVLYPLMIVLAARGMVYIHDCSPQWGKRMAVGCLLLAGFGTSYFFPRYLAAFNALVAGPAGGLHISVIGEDWGQDVGALADSVLENDLAPFYYPSQYEMRIMELESRGIEVNRISCGDDFPTRGWVAIHITKWKRLRNGCFYWTTEQSPSFSINNHILVWEIPDDALASRRRPPAAGDTLWGLPFQWKPDKRKPDKRKQKPVEGE
jgi:hypothetical protein